MKTLFTITLIIALTSIFPIRSSALSTNPSSDDFISNSTISIDIKAVPQGIEDAVEVNIDARGMTIIDFAEVKGLTAIGSCTGDTKFTPTQICVSIAKSSAFTANESIGTVVVQFGSESSADLVLASTSAYSDGFTIRSVGGSLATFVNNDSSQPTNLPDKDINKDNRVIPALIGGILVVSIVLIATYIFSKMRSKSV